MDVVVNNFGFAPEAGCAGCREGEGLSSRFLVWILNTSYGSPNLLGGKVHVDK